MKPIVVCFTPTKPHALPTVSFGRSIDESLTEVPLQKAEMRGAKTNVGHLVAGAGGERPQGGRERGEESPKKGSHPTHPTPSLPRKDFWANLNSQARRWGGRSPAARGPSGAKSQGESRRKIFEWKELGQFA